MASWISIAASEASVSTAVARGTMTLDDSPWRHANITFEVIEAAALLAAQRRFRPAFAAKGGFGETTPKLAGLQSSDGGQERA